MCRFLRCTSVKASITKCTLIYGNYCENYVLILFTPEIWRRWKDWLPRCWRVYAAVFMENMVGKWTSIAVSGNTHCYGDFFVRWCINTSRFPRILKAGCVIASEYRTKKWRRYIMAFRWTHFLLLCLYAKIFRWKILPRLIVWSSVRSGGWRRSRIRLTWPAPL